MEDVLCITFHGKEVVTKSINARLGWTGVKCIANKMMNSKSWYFHYKDDEGDTILGTTEAEWQAVMSISKTCRQFPVNIWSLDDNMAAMTLTRKNNSNSEYLFVSNSTNSDDKKVSLCKPSSGCCKPKVKEESCYPKPNPNLMKCSQKSSAPISEENKEPMCDISSGCCSYQRPLPPDPIFDENEIPVKIKNPTLPAQKYTKESLRALACPLGALGGGCISIAGDGGLRQWQISNKVNHLAQVPDSFFAIKAGSSAAVLQSNTWYDQKGFKPSAYITDHVVPSESRILLTQLPGVETVEVTARYPVVGVDYIDDKLKNLDIHLEAWSPKIPHNTKDSAIPVIIFDYHITNKGDAPVKVSLLGSLQNIIGWDGYTSIVNEVEFAGYGGNANSLHTTSSLYGINMGNSNIAKNEETYGHIEIAALTESSDKRSTILQYDKVTELWKAFTSSECLPGQGIPGVSMAGKTFNGALSISRNVDAGKKTVFKFLIFWHIPNRYKDWGTFVSVPHTPLWIGTQYAKIWPTIDNVIEYTLQKLPYFKEYTYKFQNSMFNSSLPWEMIDSAAGRVSVLNSQTCLWPDNGYFYAFEGCSTKGGCCPLNCTHVWNYEMTLAYLYPDLERTMRETDLLQQITPHGVIPSRTECPVQIARAWNFWKNYTMNPASTQICVDGEMGTVLKLYREIKLGASKKWFNIMYDPMKLVVRHWLDVLDSEKNGLVFGPQPNTFDVCTYGYMVIWGLLYLCGLRAAEEVAKLVGDKEFADECHKRFALGTVNLDRVCFTNGKWYTHVVDPHHNVDVLTDCTFVGALYGQWWANLLSLGYLLPKEHIKSHLKYTYERNYIASFNPADQSPRKYCDQRDDGWVMGQWDSKEAVPKNSLRYCREASWSGVLYPFASLMIMEGLKDEGLNVLKVNRYLYDGTRRSPWNEIECGDHYARPMSSFSLFQTGSGQNWTLSEDGSIQLGFKPTITADNFTGFFSLGTCWGTYSQVLGRDNSSAEVDIVFGSVDIESLTVQIPCISVVAKVDDSSEISTFMEIKDNGNVTVRFASKINLKDGQVLSLEFK